MTDWDILQSAKNRNKKALERLEALQQAQKLVDEYTFKFDGIPTLDGFLSFLDDELKRLNYPKTIHRD